MTRLVLRLWRSHYRFANGTRADGVADGPIWYGALYQEVFQQPWHFVTLGAITIWPVPPSFLDCSLRNTDVQPYGVRRRGGQARGAGFAVRFRSLLLKR